LTNIPYTLTPKSIVTYGFAESCVPFGTNTKHQTPNDAKQVKMLVLAPLEKEKFWEKI